MNIGQRFARARDMALTLEDHFKARSALLSILSYLEGWTRDGGRIGIEKIVRVFELELVRTLIHERVGKFLNFYSLENEVADLWLEGKELEAIELARKTSDEQTKIYNERYNETETAKTSRV